MSGIPAGAMRFNSDSQKLEYWNGSAWFQVHTATPNMATSGDREPGARVIVAGGNNYEGSTSVSAEIQYFNIASTGNTVDFGTNLTQARRRLGGMSSSTRGVFSGGATPDNTTTQDFVEFASTGTCTAWGDSASTSGTANGMGFSNSTRGIVKSGYVAPTGATGTMDYITIASAGNTQDFGDLSKHGDSGGVAGNSTRALMGGGLIQPSTLRTQELSFVTIPTLGNNVIFGQLSIARWSCYALANKTRTVFGGGSTPTKQSVIDYGVISSLGNAINFGDLTVAGGDCAAASNCIRGLFAGGYRNPNSHASSIIDYIEIATEGNAIDFGDLAVQNDTGAAGVSNAHGGL